MVELSNQGQELFQEFKQGGLHTIRYNSLCRLNDTTALAAHGVSLRAFKIENNQVCEHEELYTTLGHEVISVLRDYKINGETIILAVSFDGMFALIKEKESKLDVFKTGRLVDCLACIRFASLSPDGSKIIFCQEKEEGYLFIYSVAEDKLILNLTGRYRFGEFVDEEIFLSIRKVPEKDDDKKFSNQVARQNLKGEVLEEVMLNEPNDKLLTCHRCLDYLVFTSLGKGLHFLEMSTLKTMNLKPEGKGARIPTIPMILGSNTQVFFKSNICVNFNFAEPGTFREGREVLQVDAIPPVKIHIEDLSSIV